MLLQAQGKGGGSAVPGCAGGGLSQLLPMVIIFIVFYMLIIRPQQKKVKDHRAMLDNLKRGDQIITNGGMMGKITGLTDRYVVLEVAEKIRLKVLRSHILGKQGDGNAENQTPPPADGGS